MSWDERQRAMLAEMGYRLPAWPAAAPAVEVPDEPPPAAAAPVAMAAPAAAPAVRAAAPTTASIAAPAPAIAAAFAGLDWSTLREAVAACRSCGLCQQRRNAVFGNGAAMRAQWLVVTDPPDEADDAAGDAMSADAGRLLDRMLLAAGLTRTGDAPTAFVTPVVKCRPPRGRAPQPAELDACEAVLARQVELLQPRLVLALGVQAARRLTGLTEPLGRLRGRVHAWRGLPVVVSYPPAYLLRTPADKAGAWDDLRLALQAAKAPARGRST
ncbi:uracil-DNA glycosylase [Pelomonas cellulosilytica]|uniref:Type-4 uracil-DNA glycosylase n=1 Tax=Pelomonas cellulosilytica TaxID=2906762 RepID=A0ABS8Y2B1_9BURK|nr:uracil-DNA glycosylase [Pelomonas sp. P8]MCE4557221.1 uracil-DNA glycosylase [Pelomonas sp. P8]